MEPLFDLLLWGMAGMLALAPLGAAFGALARLAQGHPDTPDGVRGRYIRHGAISGAMFLGALGFVASVVLIRHDSFEGSIRQLAGLAGGFLALMLLALLFAGVGQFFVWLGVRGTGLLLMFGIAMMFAVIVAVKAGYDRQVVALAATGMGLTTLAVLIVLRIRSPYGADAFNPWANDADMIEE